MSEEIVESTVQLDGVQASKPQKAVLPKGLLGVEDIPERPNLGETQEPTVADDFKDFTAPANKEDMEEVDSWEQFVKLREHFYKLDPPNMKDVVRNYLDKAATFIDVDVPTDIVDSKELMIRMAKANNFRRNLVQMQVNISKWAKMKDSCAKSLLKIARGFASGSSADKREAEAVARCVEFEQNAFVVIHAAEQIANFIEQLDKTSMALVAQQKMLDSPTGRMLLEGDDI